MLQIASGLGDLVPQRLRHREVLEHATMSAKASWNARTSRLVASLEPAVQAVKQRMRRLVRDDVVRDRGEHDAAGQHAPAPPRTRRNSREEAPAGPGCSRRSRPAERADRSAGAGRSPRVTNLPSVIDAPRRPKRNAAERLLEMLDGLHRDRVDHLLMELRVCLRWAQARSAREVRVIEVDRGVAAATRGVDVDDFDIFADRAWFEVLFPANAQGAFIDADRFEPRSRHGS